MLYNINSGYGSWFGPKETNGKVFLVYSSSETNAQTLRELWRPDSEGVQRAYTDFTTALAACGTGTGDKIFVSQGYTTAPTLTELATCATKGVLIEQLGGKLSDAYVTQRATANLPQTGSSNLFTVTAPVRVLDIIGEVTTVVQTQANSVQLQVSPTVGSVVDLCTSLNITASATGTILGITGTLANALQSNANGVLPSQAAPVTVPAGSIRLLTSASSTGAVKWVVRYQPLVPGARVVAA